MGCHQTPKPLFQLSKRDKLGIGIGVGVPGLLLLLWFVVAVVKRYKRRTWERQKWVEDRDALPPAYHMVNLDRKAGDRGSDVPPEYRTVASVPLAVRDVVASDNAN
jgi:hypothetical protein